MLRGRADSWNLTLSQQIPRGIKDVATSSKFLFRSQNVSQAGVQLATLLMILMSHNKTEV